MILLEKKISDHIIRNLTVSGRAVLLACKRSGCRSGLPGFAMYRDFIPDYFGVNYVIAGRGCYTDARGSRFVLRPGSLFQRVPTASHSTSMEPGGYDEYCLTFDVRTFRHLLALGIALDRPPVFQLQPSDAVIRKFKAFGDLLRSEDAPAAELMLHAQQLLLFLYGGVRMETDGWDALIREARSRLPTGLEHRSPVSELLGDLGAGYHTLRRVFRERTGSSPADYRIRCRMDRACELLASCNVQETAQRLGYPDPFTFSEQFKRFTGMPPRQYRDMLRRGA